MQKLSVLTELYYPEETSTGHILTQICEALAVAYSVTVITGPSSQNFCKADFPGREVHNSVNIIRCSGTSFDKNNLVGRLLNAITRTGTLFWQGLHHCHSQEIMLVVTNPPTLPVVAYLIAKLKGCPYVVIVHDVYPDVLDIMDVGGWLIGLKSLWRQVNQVVYRNAAKIVVLGRDMSHRVAQNYLPTDHTDKLVCIHNWAQVDTIFPDARNSNSLLQELNLTQKFVVLYAGNLGRTHGVEVFAEAIKALREQDDIHFLTIAAGKKRPWLQQYIAEHSLSNATLVPLENRPRSEQHVSLNAGDVVIIAFLPGMSGISVPSRMYNCMAAGKPIIAVTDADSELARVIDEEQIGWVVAPEDAGALIKTIEFAASHPELCLEMGQRAVAAARSKYTFEKAIAGYQKLIESLVPSH